MSLQYHGGAFASGLKKFTGAVVGRQIDTGKAYYGKNPNISNFLPNFSDSMSQLDPRSDKFVPELYDMLTPAEKNKLTVNKQEQIVVSQVSSFLPFLSIFQNTREGLQEMIGIRDPELLKKAIERYEIKLIEDEDLQREAKIDAEVQKEITEFESRMKAEELNKNVNRGLHISAPDQAIPVVQPVNTYDIPIDITRGRGLNIFDDEALFKHRRNRHNLK
jgi:hypothetical protein